MGDWMKDKISSPWFLGMRFALLQKGLVGTKDSKKKWNLKFVSTWNGVKVRDGRNLNNVNDWDLQVLWICCLDW
jgi:hypothetical protein